MNEWTAYTSDPLNNPKKQDHMMTNTSLSAIARQVDPHNAAKRIDDMTNALNAFRKPQQWILVSPDGEMWAGDTKQLLGVLTTRTPIGSKFL